MVSSGSREKTNECNYETDTNESPRTTIKLDRQGWYSTDPDLEVVIRASSAVAVEVILTSLAGD